MKFYRQCLDYRCDINRLDTKVECRQKRFTGIFTALAINGLRTLVSFLQSVLIVPSQFFARILALIVLVVLFSQQAIANDQDSVDGERAIQEGETVEASPKLDYTFYLRMDAIVKSELFIDPGQEEFVDFLDVSLGFDVYYGRFFIEANNQANRSNRSSTIGYRLAESADYQLDFLLGQTYLDALSETDGNLIRTDPSEELRGIRNRDNEVNQGLRFTHYSGNQAWWIDVAGDPFNIAHGGWVIDGYFARAFQLYNWELHAGLGVTLFSEAVVDYHAGVSLEEVTPLRPVYEAGFGSRYSLDLSAQYPLSKDWVLVSGYTFRHYSSSFADSPLYKSNQQHLFSLGVMYVW